MANQQIVLERKYRPKRLDQVVGQTSVVRTLTNAMSLKKLHHAYLFVGQFGSGKTTVARILAAMENCEVSPGVKPCGICSICKAIFEGSHTDVKEIDAASEAGSADQVRELKKEAHYNPVDGAKTKYFIIDECHRMSAQSNDALLKLLEEPPSRTRFVLCTTDVGKMRPAIVSRCQRHDFTKIFWMQMAEALVNVAKQEKINIDTGSINLCARMAQGSMRSALNYLEKLVTYAGNKENITIADAESMFGCLPEMQFYDLIDELLQDKGTTDASKAFRIINQMFIQGADFQTILNGISQHLGSMLTGMTSKKASEFVFLTEDRKARLINQLKKCKAMNNPSNKGIKAIMKALDKLSSASQWVVYNGNPEIALRKWFIDSLLEFQNTGG